MKPCPNCNFYNTNDRERCLKCNCVLEHSDEVKTKALKKRTEVLSRLTKVLSNIFYSIRRTLSSSLPTHIHHRNLWLAGWLSFIPGAGQLYNHQPKKAVIFIIGFFIFLYFSIITITKLYSNLVLFSFLLYIFFLFNDGLTTAIKISEREWHIRNILATYSYLLFMFGALALISQYLFLPLGKLVTIREDSLAPFFL